MADAAEGGVKSFRPQPMLLMAVRPMAGELLAGSDNAKVLFDGHWTTKGCFLKIGRDRNRHLVADCAALLLEAA